jgi:hypothetical protein
VTPRTTASCSRSASASEPDAPHTAGTTPGVHAPGVRRFRAVLRSVTPVEPVTIVFIVVAAIAVFVIAAVVVGREAYRLDAVAPRSVYLIDEVVEFVAEYLPPETQARLTPDELEQLLTFHMRWLHAKGLQPTNVIDRRQDITDLVIVGEDDLVAHLLGQAEEAGIEVIDDIDVVNVVDAHLAYFGAIGAVGPKVVDLDP